jgi:hypothetical protein
MACGISGPLMERSRALPLLVCWLVFLWFSMAGDSVRAAVDPCCAVTAIDPANGIVSASEKATGRTFQFKVANAQLLQSLRVGQDVYANYTRRLVSLDGSSACCRMVTLESLAQVTQVGSSAAATGAGRTAPAAGSSGATANTASSPGATTAQSSKPADEKKTDDTGDKVKKEIKNQLKKRLKFP